MAPSEDMMNLVCPRCGREFTEPLDRRRREPIASCPSCKAPTGIDVTDVLQTLQVADDALADMEAALMGAGGGPRRSCPKAGPV
jgi:hydrogenase maturation factor HypF (carbamoyltransferase family)